MNLNVKCVDAGGGMLSIGFWYEPVAPVMVGRVWRSLWRSERSVIPWTRA